MANRFKTFFLMTVLTVIFLLVGWFFAGREGAVIAFIFAAFTNFIAYWFSDKMVLKRYRAQEVTSPDSRLYRVVQNLVPKAGLPMPKVYVIKDPSPNAFATGRDPAHSSVAVTTGLLKRLNRLELEGVIAHELSHIKNYDIRFTLLIISLIGAIGILAGCASRMWWFGGRGRGKGGGGLVIIAVILGILAPIIAQLIKLAISRKREYMADASGALLTRYPQGLADALKKISQAEPMKSVDEASAPLYISNPFGKKFASNLLSTHPPIEDRIKKLEKM